MPLDDATLDSLRQQKPGGVIVLRFESGAAWFEVEGRRTPFGLWSTEIRLGDGRKLTKDLVTEAQVEEHLTNLCLALQAQWLNA